MNQYPEQSPSQYCVAGVLTCYCGPSAEESILYYINPVSADGEHLVSSTGDWTVGQYGLAGGWGNVVHNSPYSWKYLETNSAHGTVPGGETPWWSGGTDYPMSGTINWWVSRNYSGSPYYVENPLPGTGKGGTLTLTTYEADLTSDIWNQGAGGWPLAADVWEFPGKTPYLNGHNTNLEVQHFITLYGYGSSGATTAYIDPIYGSALNGHSGFNLTSSHYTGYPSSSIVSLVNYGATFGIVW